MMWIARLALLLALGGVAHAQTFGNIPAGAVIGNNSAASRSAASSSLTSLFDRAFCATANSALARVGGSWVCLATANNSVWATNGSGVPTLTQTLPNAVQDNITRAGTITSGVWNGTAIANGFLVNSSVTIGSTTVSLGATVSKITGLGAPTAASDAATKAYADALASGVHQHTAVVLATAAVLPNTPTYANGASGVGATLTAGANAAIVVDGTAATLNQRVLVKDQAAPLQNGVYTVTTVGSGAAAWVLTRATDMDDPGDPLNPETTMQSGSQFFVSGGSLNINTTWVMTNTVVTVGTTAANFAQSASGVGATQWLTTGSDISYSSGNVGINVASPTTPLHVKKATTGVSGTFETTAGTNYLQLLSHVGGGNFGSVLNFQDGATASAYITSVASGGLQMSGPAGSAWQFDSSKFSSTGLGINTATVSTSGDAFAALQTVVTTYGEIKLPCGTFLISSELTPNIAGATISGSGKCTIIKNTYIMGSYQHAFRVLSTDNVTIRDLTIDMDNKGSSAACINIEHSSYAKIINVTCKNSLNGGFTFAQLQSGGTDGSHYGLVDNCYMETLPNAGANSHAIEISYSNYMVVKGCIMKAVDNGVNIASSEHVAITGNTMFGSGSTIGFAGIRCTNDSTNVSATGNVIRAITRGIFLLGCNDSTFVGNTIRDTYHQCMLIQASTASGAPTLFNTISGNHCTSNCTGGVCVAAIELNVSGGSVAADLQGNIITGTTIRDEAGTIVQDIVLSGSTLAGNNTCATNRANVTMLGSC